MLDNNQTYDIQLKQVDYQWLAGHETELNVFLKQAKHYHIPKKMVIDTLKDQQHYRAFMQHYTATTPFSHTVQKALPHYNELMLFFVHQHTPKNIRKSLDRTSEAAFHKIENSMAIVLLPIFILFALFCVYHGLWALMFGAFLIMLLLAIVTSINLIEAQDDWRTYLRLRKRTIPELPSMYEDDEISTPAKTNGLYRNVGHTATIRNTDASVIHRVPPQKARTIRRRTLRNTQKF